MTRSLDKYVPFTFDPQQPYITVWDGTVFQVLDEHGDYNSTATAAAYQAYLSSHPVPDIPSPPTPPTPLPDVNIHVVTFLERVPLFKRIAIREVAKVNPVVEDFLDILNKAEQVILDAPDVIGGLQYLVSQNLLTVEEAKVCSPYYPD